MTKKVIIIGGGIGGFAASVALHRAGIEATLFERAPAFGEVGAGLSLWPNATRILQGLGVLDAIVARGEPATHFNLLQPNGTLIAAIPMGGFSTPSVCLHRADLHAVLVAALPAGSLETNRSLEAFLDGPPGVIAQFAGGLKVEADGLVGADGIRSVVRGQLHGPKDPVYRGYVIWRGIAPVPRGGVRGHLMEYWGRGQRFGLMPIGQGRMCWYATRNAPPGEPEADRKETVERLFQGWHPSILDLIAATDPGAILRNEARDRPPLKAWGRGNVTLLGDAAHPITPNVGQGACLAIEDAAVLARCLRSAANVAEGFRSYEAVRRRRTAQIAARARRIGMIGQWENPVLVGLRNWAARLVISRFASQQLNAMYAYEA